MLCFFELFACTLIQKKFTGYLWRKKNHPCSTDGTANMAAPYCIHLDNFLILQVFGWTSVLVWSVELGLIFVGRWLVSAGSRRPVIRLRPVRRLLMVSSWWIGRLLR